MNKLATRKFLGITLGLSILVGAAAAEATSGTGPQLINPNDGVAWGSWGPISQSDSLFTAGWKVRGQVSKRHARDRLFYNTNSNVGGYHRRLHVACTSQTSQDDNPIPGFTNDTDGDLTFYCNSGNTLILPPANRTLNGVVDNESFAVIDSNAF